MGIYRQQIERLLRYRDLSAHEASLRSGFNSTYLGRYLHPENARHIQKMSSASAMCLAKTLDVPRDAIEECHSPHSGRFAGWHPIDMADSSHLENILKEMPATRAILSVGRLLDTHLVHDDMALKINQLKFTDMKLGDEELHGRIEHVRKVIVTRSELRNTLKTYNLYVIAPTNNLLWAQNQDQSWISHLCRQIVVHKPRTALGLIPQKLWPAAYASIASVMPQNAWDHINIGWNILACVWIGTSVYYTYCPKNLDRLREVILDKVYPLLVRHFPRPTECDEYLFRDAGELACVEINNYLDRRKLLRGGEWY